MAAVTTPACRSGLLTGSSDSSSHRNDTLATGQQPEISCIHFKKQCESYVSHNPDETPHDRIYETVTCLQRCNIHGDPIHYTSHPLEIARCSFWWRTQFSTLPRFYCNWNPFLNTRVYHQLATPVTAQPRRAAHLERPGGTRVPQH